MKSTIRIKTDYDTITRIPVLEIRKVESDDPRDEMLADFLELISNNYYMCMLEFEKDRSNQYYYKLSPVIADEELRQWWMKNVNKIKEIRSNRGSGSSSLNAPDSEPGEANQL